MGQYVLEAGTKPSKGGRLSVVKVFDKLNTPAVLVVVSVLFVVVDGLLFYRYWLTTETAASSAPSVDAVLATYKEDDGPGEQEEPAVKESDDEAEQPNGEKNGVIGAEEPETEPAPLSAPDPGTPVQPPVDQAALAAEENAAVLPAPVAAPAYPEPVYEEYVYEE